MGAAPAEGTQLPPCPPTQGAEPTPCAAPGVLSAHFSLKVTLEGRPDPLLKTCTELPSFLFFSRTPTPTSSLQTLSVSPIPWEQRRIRAGTLYRVLLSAVPAGQRSRSLVFPLCPLPPRAGPASSTTGCTQARQGCPRADPGCLRGRNPSPALSCAQPLPGGCCRRLCPPRSFPVQGEPGVSLLLTLRGSRMLRCTRLTISFTMMSMGTPSGMAQVTVSAAAESDRSRPPASFARAAKGSPTPQLRLCVRANDSTALPPRYRPG